MFKFWKRDKISTLLTDTFIGEGTIVEGAIRSAGSVRLEGQLRGDVFSEGDVVLGESAFAISNITARNVFLAGQVTGNVRISGKLTIAATGKLYGDLDAATIAIEEGGVFQGNSAMDTGEPVVSPVERRGGRDRRAAGGSGYDGEERRSGYDRRDKDGQSALRLSRLASDRVRSSLAAAETAAGPEDAPATTPDTTPAAPAAPAADPLRESGRAFMQSMHGGGRQAGAAAEGISEDERAALGMPGHTVIAAASLISASKAGPIGDTVAAEGSSEELPADTAGDQAAKAAAAADGLAELLDDVTAAADASVDAALAADSLFGGESDNAAAPAPATMDAMLATEAPSEELFVHAGRAPVGVESDTALEASDSSPSTIFASPIDPNGSVADAISMELETVDAGVQSGSPTASGAGPDNASRREEEAAALLRNW
ncbi:bactofilin family protein [Paenibacillus sacheonensis]|uniref:Polymer-forming cytoskeletal protein n=1 Tax=Paenibacillus sacheonensis TaxID=742054 RepID=A0A7X4YUS7_9BACL|nr:polymer-forming cytoskeletal protein [Paenibacillus sacheonensis]MBM7568032.1 cytoskeletal protein CcmA (bactofilin family) [Paenibacillus sacheonensis]NBC72938.1 hypothetical protein [Paenibacillus sacheonensis]